MSKLPLTNFDTTQAIAVVWKALHGYQDTIQYLSILTTDEGRTTTKVDDHAEEWDEICTAMAWITDALPESERSLTRLEKLMTRDFDVNGSHILGNMGGKPVHALSGHDPVSGAVLLTMLETCRYRLKSYEKVVTDITKLLHRTEDDNAK